MATLTTSARNRIDGLWRDARANPVRSLKRIGVVSLLVYLVYAVLPLVLPDTDKTLFPPYIALPEGDYELENFFFLYAFLSAMIIGSFSLYYASLGMSTPGKLEPVATKNRLGLDRSLSVIFFFAALFHLLMLLTPTMLSTDLFDYIRHGRIFAIYGENPMIVPATFFNQDPFFDLGGWVGTGSVYGPLHVYITGALAWIGGDSFAPTFLLFRGFFVTVNMVNLVLIWRIARRLKPGLEKKALLFYGWNPFVLILVVSNAHNDILMLAFVLAGFLMYMDRRLLLGALFITLAILVKFIALPILLVYIALAIRQQAGPVKKLAMGAGCLAVFALTTVVTYLPLWEGRDTFKFMTSVGQKANFTLPGLIRDVAAGHLQFSFSQTVVQLSFAALLAAYMIWHMLAVKDIRQLISASAGLAFLTPLALFWFQPWYLTLALGLVALRPWRLLYVVMLAFSFSLMFFDGFWWHTPVSMDVQKPMRVLIVFGTPLLILLVLKGRDMLPSLWQKTISWSLETPGPGNDGETAVSDPSTVRMAFEVIALLVAAAVPMAVVISTSPQLRSLANLVMVKLKLLINI